MSTTNQITMPILGMTCANCAATVERNVKKVDGVEDAAVNFGTEKLTVTYDPARAAPDAVAAPTERYRIAPFAGTKTGAHRNGRTA